MGRKHDAKVPVVVLHGALRGRLGIVPTAWMLRRHGLDARTFGYSARRGSLEAHAASLQRFVQEWLGTSPSRLGFVTHSMGALVVRAYLARLGPAPATRHRVVMLSPPNRGSELAWRNRDRRAFRWLYGQAADALQPERVQALPTLPSDVDALVLAGGRGDRRGYNRRLTGDDDGVVAVREMGLPDCQPEMVGGIHGLLQWRPAVVARAAAFLRDGTGPPGDRTTP